MSWIVPPLLLRNLRRSGLCGLVILTGCTGVYRVDNQVESFARWADVATPTGAKAPSHVPAPPQRYRFERLPSQAAGAAAEMQNELEQWTQAALAPLGWTPADRAGDAVWTVQVSAQSSRLPRAPWEDPWHGDWPYWTGRVNIGIGVGTAGSGGMVMWNPWPMRAELPYYERQVALVIRHADSGRVVYETRAAHDGRWNSSPGLWQAMLKAALQDFPAPPAGERQVNLDVPR